jgi:2-polyprenyl-3-methyl-5-hydroxy-6-metoxy-1,4-benzoquinol methylase
MSPSSICTLCGASALPTLQDRPDYEYGVAVRLDYWRCMDCGLVFAEPIPSHLIPSFYEDYSTHQRADGNPHNGFWRIMDVLSPAIDQAGSFASIGVAKNAHILDFGCGAGIFLDKLRAAGFTELAGCDFDPKVAAAALPDLRFFAGIDQLGEESFDVITMNHVIEHLEDVPAMLKRLRSHLRPNGFIYIRTPNPQSVLATLFGSNWRGWETPRHLNLLSPKAMQLAAEKAGGELAKLVTSNDMRAGMLLGSVGIAFGNGLPKKLAGVALYVPFAWLSTAAKRLNCLSGEELVAIVR